MNHHPQRSNTKCCLKFQGFGRLCRGVLPQILLPHHAALRCGAESKDRASKIIWFISVRAPVPDKKHRHRLWELNLLFLDSPFYGLFSSHDSEPVLYFGSSMFLLLLSPHISLSFVRFHVQPKYLILFLFVECQDLLSWRKWHNPLWESPEPLLGNILKVMSTCIL